MFANFFKFAFHIDNHMRNHGIVGLRSNGICFTVHVLDAPLDIRRERVRRRNAEKGATFSMVVPDHIFEMASAMWEPPDDLELEEYEFFSPTPAIGA